VLVELGVVEQRYRAVLEVLDEGAAVTDVARRYGVARQTVHEWLRRYANDGGLGGLADRSSRPERCPHQMPAAVEARVVWIRRRHPAWGPSRICWELEREGREPLPGRSSVYRALVRHGLIDPKKRKRVDGAAPARQISDWGSGNLARQSPISVSSRAARTVPERGSEVKMCPSAWLASCVAI
jgi:transposase